MSNGRLPNQNKIALELLARSTASLTESLFSEFGSILRGRPKARWIVGILSSSWLMFALVAGVYVKAGPVEIFGRAMTFDNILPLLLIPSLFAFFFLLEVLASLENANNRQDTIKTFLREAREANYSAQNIGPLPEQQAKTFDILEVIQSNLDQLIDYYIINKAQAITSFRSSIIAISTWFATIILGVWLAYAGVGNHTAAYMSALAGIVLQFIGGAFFFLYTKSLVQLNFFFARLVLMQDTMLGIRLADSIPDSKEKHQILERLIFAIVQRNAIAPDYLKTDKRTIAPKPRMTRSKAPPESA